MSVAPLATKMPVPFGRARLPVTSVPMRFAAPRWPVPPSTTIPEPEKPLTAMPRTRLALPPIRTTPFAPGAEAPLSSIVGADDCAPACRNPSIQVAASVREGSGVVGAIVCTPVPGIMNTAASTPAGIGATASDWSSPVFSRTLAWSTN
jgi:hypothetical protein